MVANRSNAYPLLLILQAWAAVLVAINPLGNFPVVDDWAYLKSVKALVEHGALVYSDWTAPNLISQVVWGALFAFPFGVSYTALRLSTEVLALAGVAALYWILRECRSPPGVALLGALLFLINPLVCVMSASFMSDVPYTAAQIVAMLLLILGLKSGSKRQLAAGWAVAVLALLCRQTGMAIPIGFGAAQLARSGFGKRSLLTASAPFAAFLAIQWLFQAGLSTAGIAPANFGHQIDLIASNMRDAGIAALAGNVLLAGVDSLRFLGLVLLPLSLLIIAPFTQALPRPAAALIWFWLTVAALLVAAIEPPMQIWSNMAWSVIGPDVAGAPVSSAFWPVVSIASAFGGIALAFALTLKSIALFQNLRSETSIPALFSIVTAAALFGSMALLPRDKQFDRYVLPVIPCFIVFLSARFGTTAVASQPVSRWAPLVSNAAFAAVAAWSVFGTHDYFAEKRVQWSALQDLVQNGHVPPELVDAGWVFNAPTSFGVYGNPNRTETWFRRQDYIIASDLLPNLAGARGFTQLRDYPVARWAPWIRIPARIVVLRRNQPRKE